jgi:hypothetical protein
MAVIESDIVQYQSAASGSTGGAITGSSITSGVPNNVWPNVTNAQRIAGIVLARKTFWKNNNSTDSMVKPALWLPTPPADATLVIGLGTDSSDDADYLQGNMTGFGSAAQVYLASDGADTRVVTVYGLDNSGTPVPTTEDITLAGTSPRHTTATFSKVFGAWADSTDGSRAITVREGSGGTIRGTIAATKKACWLWLAATTITAGILMPDLAPSQSIGLWRRLTVAAGASPVRPDTLTVRAEENA